MKLRMRKRRHWRCKHCGRWFRFRWQKSKHEYEEHGDRMIGRDGRFEKGSS